MLQIDLRFGGVATSMLFEAVSMHVQIVCVLQSFHQAISSAWGIPQFTHNTIEMPRTKLVCRKIGGIATDYRLIWLHSSSFSEPGSNHYGIRPNTPFQFHTTPPITDRHIKPKPHISDIYTHISSAKDLLQKQTNNKYRICIVHSFQLQHQFDVAERPSDIWCYTWCN